MLQGTELVFGEGCLYNDHSWDHLATAYDDAHALTAPVGSYPSAYMNLFVGMEALARLPRMNRR